MTQGFFHSTPSCSEGYLNSNSNEKNTIFRFEKNLHFFGISVLRHYDLMNVGMQAVKQISKSLSFVSCIKNLNFLTLNTPKVHNKCVSIFRHTLYWFWQKGLLETKKDPFEAKRPSLLRTHQALLDPKRAPEYQKRLNDGWKIRYLWVQSVGSSGQHIFIFWSFSFCFLFLLCCLFSRAPQTQWGGHVLPVFLLAAPPCAR